MNGFAGKRILLVEDEPIVAMMVSDMIGEIGATVVGPAMTLAAAMSLAETQRLDAAVLDINLNGARSDAVAELLMRRGVPVVFATGYGVADRGGASGAPVLDKPYTKQGLTNALSDAFSRRI